MLASITTKAQLIHFVRMHVLSTPMPENRSRILGYLKACDENQTGKISPNILPFIIGKCLKQQTGNKFCHLVI